MANKKKYKRYNFERTGIARISEFVSIEATSEEEARKILEERDWAEEDYDEKEWSRSYQTYQGGSDWDEEE